MVNENYDKISDHRNRYQHMEFQYSRYYLYQFCEKHHVTYDFVCHESDLSPVTFHKILEGKDKHINCFIRMFAAFEPYCDDKDELSTFIAGYIQRMMVEIWTFWGIEPKGWDAEIWELMQKEKAEYEQKQLDKSDKKD